MVAKALWTCVLQDQTKFRSDSIHVTPLETAGSITVMIPYCGQMSHETRGCLAWMWWVVSVWGLVLLVVGFSCVGKYIAVLIHSLGMSAAALSTGS